MIIFGLGNPGLKYRSTRHNVGMMVLNEMARHYRKRFRFVKDHMMCAIEIGGERISLIKPISWMNQSGIVIERILKKHSDTCLVIVDDIALPLGRVRLRSRGSDGGHKGLRSIIEILRTEDFARLRFGVGEPFCNPADYVLSRFTRDERGLLKSVINLGIKGIEILIKDGFEKGQNFINGIDLTEKQ